MRGDNSFSYYVIKELPINNEIIKSFNSEDHKKCSICLTSDISIQTDCKHNYCFECISKWYCKNNSCPYCRKIITTTYRLK